jgi:AcrR family transcriptional regulator
MTETTTRRVRSDGERSRKTILRAAANLATIDGLEGISIGNLASHIGMSKSGLYAHFKSKEELQLATVETAQEIFREDVVAPAAALADPIEQLKAFSDAFLTRVERRIFPGGCFFSSVEAEFDTHDGAVKDKIVALQRERAQMLTDLVADAQAAGSIAASEDPAQVAFEITAYLLLGNTGFVLHDDPAYLHRARTAVHRLLDRVS